MPRIKLMSLIAPLHKSDKDPSKPGSYHPVSFCDISHSYPGESAKTGHTNTCREKWQPLLFRWFSGSVNVCVCIYIC